MGSEMCIRDRVSHQKTITICSIYLSPSSIVSKLQLERLIAQLPKPFLLLGDMNGHSPLWGSDNTNSQGKVLEDFISDHNQGSERHANPRIFADGIFKKFMILARFSRFSAFQQKKLLENWPISSKGVKN